MDIHKISTASFDVDAQYTFTPACPNELPVAGGLDIVEELNAQAELAAYRIGSKDAHCTTAPWVTTDVTKIAQPIPGMIEHPDYDLYWPAHGVPGTPGFELIGGLPNPEHYDYFVWKGVEPRLHPYGACFHDISEHLSTGVIEFLNCKGIITVLVGGLALDYCVCHTALQLKKAGFRVIVNRAACRSVAKESEEKALDQMYKADVIFVNNASGIAP